VDERGFDMASINHLLFLVIGFFLFAVQVSSASPKYKPVSGFELNRYLGKWYEIARLPF
jgi:apolipoprotein D and lipocalin family protein